MIPTSLLVAYQSSRDHRHEATPDIWQETFLSALLRAILYSDDPTYWLEAYRKLDPITNPEGELRFLQAAEALFMKGTYSRVPLHRALTYRLCRLASWFRPRDPSCYCGVQSFNRSYHEVLRG